MTDTSNLLKVAADRIEALEASNAKLASENVVLATAIKGAEEKTQKTAADLSPVASAISKELLNRGLVKSAEAGDACAAAALSDHKVALDMILKVAAYVQSVPRLGQAVENTESKVASAEEQFSQRLADVAARQPR